jgi:hypothetical protein
MTVSIIPYSVCYNYNQPALNISIRTVKKRSIGKDGMFGYASMNPDIQSDPTEAAAFAFYGARRFKKDKINGAKYKAVAGFLVHVYKPFLVLKYKNLQDG